MSVALQIALGSALLIVCAISHVAVAARLVTRLQRQRAASAARPNDRLFLRATGILAVFILSHTAHVYLWAGTLWATGALEGYEAPFYFALVTYTTLGYGDVTLGADHRVFGAMASVTGILMFGLTTAFLVGVFSRALERQMR